MFGTGYKLYLGYSHFWFESLVQVLGTLLQIKLPANAYSKRQRMMAQILGFYHPWGDRYQVVF